MTWRGDPWRRACAPSTALGRRLDSCLRRNDGHHRRRHCRPVYAGRRLPLSLRPPPSTRSVAVAPRSPIGYTRRPWRCRRTIVAVAPRSPIGYTDGRSDAAGSSVAVAPRSPIGYTSASACPSPMSCGCPPISHRLHFRLRVPLADELRLPPDLPSVTLDVMDTKLENVLRLPPDLPSVTLVGQRRARDYLVAVAPRSPIGYTARVRQLDRHPSCGCPPISHRLHFGDRPGTWEEVAVAPRSPIGYTPHPSASAAGRVAVAPRSPIGYTAAGDEQQRLGVAVAPRSPIGYTGRKTRW